MGFRDWTWGQVKQEVIEKVALGASDASVWVGRKGDDVLDSVGVPYVGDAVEGALRYQNGVAHAGVSTLNLGPQSLALDFAVGMGKGTVSTVWHEGAGFLRDPSLSALAAMPGNLAAGHYNNAFDASTGVASGISDSLNGIIDGYNRSAIGLSTAFGQDLSVGQLPDGFRVPDFGDFMQKHEDLLKPTVAGTALMPGLGTAIGSSYSAFKFVQESLQKDQNGGAGWSRLLEALKGPLGLGGSGGGGGPVQQGMNRAQVRTVIEALTNARSELESLIESAGHAVAALGAAWKGGDAQRFSSDFAASRKEMQQAVQMLEQMTTSLTGHADQQQDTSSH